MDRELSLILNRNENWDGADGQNVWVEWQGKRLKVTVQKPERRDTPKVKRGRICGFTDGARFRCLKFIAGIDWASAGECYFLTLGYPDHIPWGEYVDRQMHLSNFQTLLRRHYDRPVPFSWRTEWMVRKSGACVGLIAPHNHLLVYGAQMLTKKNVWDWWMRAIGERDYANVSCEEVYNAARVGLYTAKYAAKQDPCILGYDAYLGNPFGRSWGSRYAKLIPMMPKVEWRCRLDDKTREVMHVARGHATCWALGYNDSFTVLGAAAEACGRFFAQATVDGEVPNV